LKRRPDMNLFHLRPLGKDQCQWVVAEGTSEPYCGESVTGLYCKRHSAIADRQERERFRASEPLAR
jgi:hypothetical protein